MRTAHRLGAAAMVCAITAGCMSPGIEKARGQFYDGRLTEAGESLSGISDTGKDYVLALMERGMIYQTQGDYAASLRDWLTAAERIHELDYIRISGKASSLVINDRTEIYTGKPYERALLHAYTAKSYFALAQWREAAVEARLIVDGFENLNGFPDDAYTRYVAGLAFEMIRDFNGSSIEYGHADALIPSLKIDPASGRIAPSNAPPSMAGNGSELICLITIGRTPPYLAPSAGNPGWGVYPYAEVFYKGERLGRSYTLTTTANLANLTEKRLAVIKAAKTVTRIVIKESISNAVSENNELLGEVLRLLLYALEMPDDRQWETLPQWLQVARVPCPPDLDAVDLVFKNASGRTLRRTSVTTPLVRSDGKIIALVRVW